MDSDEFGEDITLKPYLKYKYQAVLTGPKREKGYAFLKAVNGLNRPYLWFKSIKKEELILFYLKKDTLRLKRKELYSSS